MHLSTHYYVISLSDRSNALFEVFRDTIIDIRNGGFPVEADSRLRGAADSIDRKKRLREVLHIVDQQFSACFRHDPLQLVVLGEREMLDIFDSVTAHRDVIVGRVEGDYHATSMNDLGKIVWPVVREAISGLLEETLHDLETAIKDNRTVSGLASVSQSVLAGTKATLVVEDDYHMRGSIQRTPQSLEISREVNVMEEIDDAVDAIIEKVLESGGHVVFTPSGSLDKFGRIVLLQRCADGSR